MGGPNYKKGRQYEYEVKKIFEKAGYKVMRSASSKGPYDLTAVKITSKYKKVTYLVCLAQCKLTTRKKPAYHRSTIN